MSIFHANIDVSYKKFENIVGTYIFTNASTPKYRCMELMPHQTLTRTNAYVAANVQTLSQIFLESSTTREYVHLLEKHEIRIQKLFLSHHYRVSSVLKQYMAR